MNDLLQRLQANLAEHYRLESPLGEGGMAIVFVATDLKHGRKVAVKVLRPELAAVIGGDRFLREIEVTSRLQHPHILPLYDSGAADGLLYYVMPLITGESLRQRLTRERQLPVSEAVSIARGVASALDYAHRQGVVHRDIKPENILLHDGQPLVADFGIALAVATAGGERLTQTGMSIGTPAYMSPEQASGDPEVDPRTDIYALGVVAYEMLAGSPPFTGPNAQAVVAAVLTTHPAPLAERRYSVPDELASAVHRALERLPADRFPNAAEFGRALERAPDWQPQRPRSRRSPPWVSVAAALGLLAAGGLIGMLARPSHPADVRRWSITLPPAAPVALTGTGPATGWPTALALSPAGDRLAYIAAQGTNTVLAMRPLDSDTAIVLPGTEGAYHPFYSPDGQWIAFFAGNLLRKVPAAGGDPVTLAQVDRITGATWQGDEMLILENEGFELHRLSATGSATDTVIHLSTQFGTPRLLPGNEWAVGTLGSGQLALLSLADGVELAITRRGVLPLDSVRQSDLLFGTGPRWVEPGFLVYAAGDGDLMAMPFDARRRRIRGEPVPVLHGVRMEAGFGYAEFAVADDGTLIYVPGRNQLYVLPALIGAGGRIDTLPFARGAYVQPRISPDGQRLAVQLRNQIGGWQVLLMDLRSGLRQQVQVAGNYRPYPASWFPNGHDLMLGLWDPVQFINYGVRIQSLETGQSEDLPLYGASYLTVAPDGNSFAFSDWHTGDLYLRRVHGDTTRTSIAGRGFASSFSPDGRWLAWGGVDGAVEISTIPPTGGVHVVAQRGQHPQWTPRGDALVYRDGPRYYRVPISTAGALEIGRPQLLAEGPFLSTFAWNESMMPDGRLLVLLTDPEQAAAALGVITSLPTHLQRVLPRR